MSKFKKGLELMKNYDIKKTDNGIKIIDNRTNLELTDERQNEQIFAENKKLLTIVEYTVFEKHLSGLNQMLENEDFTFFDEQYDKLEEYILQTFRTGGTVVPNDEYRCNNIGEYFLKRIGGLDLYGISLDTNRREEVIHAKKLINYILNRNGLKLTNLKTEVQGKDKPEKISWSTEKLSLKENLEPNNPQYTRSNKTKKIITKRRSKKKSFCGGINSIL